MYGRRWFRYGCVALVLAPAVSQGQELTLQTMNQSVFVNAPQLSPTAGEIALLSNRSGRAKLWLMEKDGSNPRLLIDDEGSEGSPVWSRSGDRIAFTRADGGRLDIGVVDRIAFISDRAGSQDVYVLDVTTGHVEQLTHETNPWDEFRWAPTWSPDGRWIAYVSNPSDPLEDDLWIVEVATRDTRKLTSGVYVMSSDERHGFRRPSNREHAYGRLMAFFQKHLSTDGGVANGGGR